MVKAKVSGQEGSERLRFTKLLAAFSLYPSTFTLYSLTFSAGREYIPRQLVLAE
jgi:hypothetical protein